jgi:hypothetical protein
MNYSIIKKIILSFFVGLLCLISSLSSTLAENSNKSLTEIFKPYWPYEAFWAIPLIDQIKPRLALKTASDGRIIGRSRCVEVDNLDQRRQFNKLAKMKNEQLHRVACKAMKLAIRKIDYLPIFEKLDPDEEILLKFNFSKGIVSSSKSIYVPVQPPQEEIKEDSE